MANKKNFCEEIWRASIGHYGGKYVEVPKEKIESFKNRFPKRQIPKRYFKRKTVQDMDFGVEFEEKFHKAYPKSSGVYYDIFFDNRTKGLKTLDNLINKYKCWRKIR